MTSLSLSSIPVIAASEFSVSAEVAAISGLPEMTDAELKRLVLQCAEDHQFEQAKVVVDELILRSRRETNRRMWSAQVHELNVQIVATRRKVDKAAHVHDRGHWQCVLERLIEQRTALLDIPSDEYHPEG